MAKLVFLGTPEYGAAVLRALIAAGHTVVGVVTQPDRPSGRGRGCTEPSPVKQVALVHGLALWQPLRLRRARQTIAALRACGADAWVLASYGQILSAELLVIPPCGCLGVHASLLPRYRGASPVAAAIRSGDAQTGVTLMLTDAGMDTGPVVAQEALTIAPRETAETLTVRLAVLGADLLVRTLPSWLAGALAPTPQNEAQATYAPPLEAHEGAIDWAHSADELDRQIRAHTPWPGSYCSCSGERLKILAARTEPNWSGPGEPGLVVALGKRIGVVTGGGMLILDHVQPAGKRPMDAAAFARGRPGWVGSMLENG